MRLVRVKDMQDVPSLISPANAEQVFLQRVAEADRFYEDHIPREATAQEKLVARQAYAGLLWPKQFYYSLRRTDCGGSVFTAGRRESRSMEAPFLSRRSLHAREMGIPVVRVLGPRLSHVAHAALDPEFAKHRLLLLLPEWYLHPNGQMPAYEFGFGDVNPPVRAWAVWHVYRMGASDDGTGDLNFLERLSKS